MDKLKPCPFCGEVACQIFDVWTETYKYGCLTSGCIGSVHNQSFSFKTDAQAIKAWNTRTQNDKE